MELKEIRKNYKEEKKKLKKTYKKIKRTARNEYREKRLSLKEQNLIDVSASFTERGKRAPQNPPKRAIIEEIGNSVTHGVGALLSVAALILMLAYSNNGVDIFGAVIYFVGLFLMFGMSCLYHSFPHGSRVKRIFRRFDYSGIYLLIGATFAPILLSYIGGSFGIIFFILQWAVIITGVTLVGVFGPARLRKLHIPLYVILGWCGLIFLPKMLASDPMLAVFILGGGVVYSLGIIPFSIKAKVSHFIWHFFVLAGAVIQWFGVFFYIYL